MRLSSCLVLSCTLLAAAPAFAQSSIQMNGLLDVGLFRDFNKVNQLGTIQRSYLAFSGQEDLGGGLKATFRLSTRFMMDDGSSEDAAIKPFWYDESTVGLQGEWGHLRLGRALSAMWAHEWEFDPWSNFNRIASPSWYLFHGLSPTDRASNNGTPEYGRMNNAVFYDSPKLHGFTFHLSLTPERTQAPGRDGRGSSVALKYKQGKATALLAHERNGSGDQDWFVGAKYQFGALTLMSAYNRSDQADSPNIARSGTLSATYQIGATTLKTSYGHQRLNGDSNRFMALGADYALSKRTTLYVSFGHQRFAQQDKRSAYGVGLAHAF